MELFNKLLKEYLDTNYPLNGTPPPGVYAETPDGKLTPLGEATFRANRQASRYTAEKNFREVFSFLIARHTMVRIP